MGLIRAGGFANHCCLFFSIKAMLTTVQKESRCCLGSLTVHRRVSAALSETRGLKNHSPKLRHIGHICFQEMQANSCFFQFLCIRQRRAHVCVMENGQVSSLSLPKASPYPQSACELPSISHFASFRSVFQRGPGTALSFM